MMDEQVFPEVAPPKKSALFKAVEGVGGTKLGSRLGRLMVPLDRRMLQRSNGRRGLLGSMAPPTLLLTTTGRTSGQPRTTPLYYHQDGDRIFVMGSNFGQQHHPAWTGNLLAEPKATVSISGKDIPVRATLLQGEECEWVFGELVKLAPVYRAYRGRTAREFRVFELEPVGADA
jgi:deazaflavin-dependent oxidoreductase (nitroreductase family)